MNTYTWQGVCNHERKYNGKIIKFTDYLAFYLHQGKPFNENIITDLNKIPDIFWDEPPWIIDDDDISRRCELWIPEAHAKLCHSILLLHNFVSV